MFKAARYDLLFLFCSL